MEKAFHSGTLPYSFYSVVQQTYINLSVQKREVEAIEQLGNTVPGFGATASQRNVAVASQLTLARTWFMRCLQEHANCGDGTNNQFYPMRLIDVRGASSHLVLTRDANENISGSYATLSHRWTNSDNFLSLTTEKVSHFRNEIPEEHISPTFRDAIIVCKALEIPYLWIDSMCILQSGQGSLEDWQSNGSAMAAIYTNSAINIGADINENANRVHTGFFHNSTAVEERTPTRLKISGSELVIYPTSMSIGIPKILDKRGWIVQEMLLAPRILRFTQGQMSWECTQNPCACEAFPAGMRNDIAGLVYREAFVSPQGRDQNRLRNLRKEILRLENALKDPAVNSTEISGSKLPELFLDCVEVYTNCNLTFPDIDKFMALSGVVSRVSELKKGGYIAGFFRDMLPRALSWKVEKPGSFLTESSRKDIRFTRSQRSQKYRAPTWSWAHLDKAIDFTGCVYHARDRFPALTEVIATNVILSYPGNLYGPIKHADLIVRGHVLKLQWSPDKPNLLLSSEKYDSGKFNIEYTLDRAIYVDSEREMLFLAIYHQSNHRRNPVTGVTGVILEVVEGVEEDRIVEVSNDRGNRGEDSGERLRQGIKDARRIGFMKMVMSIGDIKVKMEEVTLRLI